MRRREAEEVGNIVPQLLREIGLETPLNEWRAVEAWPEIVGKRVAAATDSVRIYNQVMYVKICSAAMRNNMFMQRSQLVKKINEYVKTTVISDIIFR